MDTVEINGNPAIGVSGFGFDAKVAKKFDEYKSRGLMSYARIVIAEFRAYKGISAVINNNLRYTNLLFCCIANTSQFGNNFYISQNSKIDDGEIEVVLIKTPPFYALLKLLTLSLRRKPYTSKYVNVIRVKNIEIQLENNLGHIDGDPIVYSDSTLKIQCIPKSLNVIIWLQIFMNRGEK